MASRRRGLSYRIGPACCSGIGIETIGGDLYYAIRARAFIAIVLLLALAAVGWRARHHFRHR